MAERLLHAAAIAKGDQVRIPDDTPVGPSAMVHTIKQIENGTPETGKITWTTDTGLKVVIGAATRVAILNLKESK
jgi:hypothetical protein